MAPLPRYRWNLQIYILLLAVVIMIGGAARGSVASSHVYDPYPANSVGYDVSWPNCKANKYVRDDQWGVVGVTGGLVLTENPCLKQQAEWFRTTSLYINTGFAGGLQKALRLASTTTPLHCAKTNESCLVYNYGYHAGVDAVRRASKYGLWSRSWWLDVETANSWADDTTLNRQTLRGMYQAMQDLTPPATQIGFYAYPGQWNLITGSWRNNAPAWAATGTESYEAAWLACTAPSFTGGPVVITQYTQTLDRNDVC